MACRRAVGWRRVEEMERRRGLFAYWHVELRHEGRYGLHSCGSHAAKRCREAQGPFTLWSSFEVLCELRSQHLFLLARGQTAVTSMLMSDMALSAADLHLFILMRKRTSAMKQIARRRDDL